jgi:cytochrome b subunit of formate dehydrogenase
MELIEFCIFFIYLWSQAQHPHRADSNWQKNIINIKEKEEEKRKKNNFVGCIAPYIYKDWIIARMMKILRADQTTYN